MSVKKTVTKARKAPSAFKWAMDRQLEISLSLLLIILAGNAFTPVEYHLSTHYTPAPSYHLRNKFSRFLFLSFKQPGTDLYFKGRDDGYIITFWVILFWVLREISMRWFWAPIARWAGISERRSVLRFAEQGWMCQCYTVSWTLGMYIMQSSPYRNLTTKQFYVGYPHDALTPLTKWYYLVQTSFWLQQIVVLNLEEKRKDHVQMFAHHIITNLLVGASYILNWTRIGNATLVVMDFVDILLPLAKLFDYTKNSVAADATFGVFLLSWIATRHVLYGIILYSVIFELPREVPYDWRPRDGYFNSYWSHMCFYTALIALQVMICFWFVMIAKVAYRALSGKGAEDTRSEAGDSEGEEDDDEIEDLIIEDDTLPASLESSKDQAQVTGVRLRNGNGNGHAHLEEKVLAEHKNGSAVSTTTTATTTGKGKKKKDR